MWDELFAAQRIFVKPKRTTQVLRVPSPAAFGKNEQLLTCITSSQAFPLEFFLYLHGFPDQSLDHRKECSSFGQIRPLPQRLAEGILSARPRAAFVAFNFAGTPGRNA